MFNTTRDETYENLYVHIKVTW